MSRIEGRVKTLEAARRAAAAPDWTEALPEGVTQAEAEAVGELWARLMAAYPTRPEAELLQEAIAAVDDGRAVDDDDDDDD